MSHEPSATFAARARAWALHLFTASGAVLGLLAIEAAARADAPAMFFWLLLALIVDGVDGPLARHLRVSTVLPNIDGAALDLIVDYLTYVMAPALYLLNAQRFPEGTGLFFAAFILLTSLYTFVRRDMKADTADFRGFPAIWNFVAAGFVVTDATQTATALVTILFGVLTFAPLKTVHPVRVKKWRPLTLTILATWLASTGICIALPSWNHQPVLACWYVASFYLTALCLWRSMALQK